MRNGFSFPIRLKKADEEAAGMTAEPAAALDLVLLPPPEFREICIRQNRLLDGILVLGGEDRVPHVSLFMGCVPESSLKSILSGMSTLPVPVQGVLCRVSGVRCYEREGRAPLVHLGLERSRALLDLQDAAQRLLSPYAEGRCPDSAFILDPGESLSASSRSWVLRFGGKVFW